MSIPPSTPIYDPNSPDELDRMLKLVWRDQELHQGINRVLTLDELRIRLLRRFDASPMVIPTDFYQQLAQAAERRAAAVAVKQEHWDEEPSLARLALTAPWAAALFTAGVGAAVLIWSGSSLTLPIPGNRFLSLSSASIAAVWLGAFAILLVLQFQQLKSRYWLEHTELMNYEQATGRLFDEAVEETRKSLAASFVLPAVLEILGDLDRTRYDSTLTATSFAGLSQAFDAKEELPTEEQDLLAQTTAHMRGGSIGIAGPRGVGKSTLLAQWCTPARRYSADRPTLAMLISAPVQYDTRDFLLYLMYSLCRAALVGAPATLSAQRDRFRQEHEWRERRRYFQIRDFRVAQRNSLILCATGVLLSVAALVSTQLSHSWDWIGDPLLDLGVTPVRCFWIGVGIFGLGLLVRSRYFPLLRHMGRSLEVNEWLPSSGDDVFGLIEDARIKIAENDNLPTASRQPVGEILAELCSQILVEIKFQQSYSSGWSGGLRLPVGLDAGIQRSLDLAKHQLSVPEILDAYRQIAKLLAAHYVVAIGIDELDKLESPQSAEALLNDLKLLFDVEGCFYFVTVSESALASFESRGIRVRDIMDSSFDTVVRLGYLSLQNARALLARRALGLPAPFAALCHALSGGLPRDLIRVCRLVAEARGEGKLSLSEVARSVLEADLVARTRAFAFDVRQAGFAEDLARVVPVLSQPPRSAAWDEVLTARSAALADWSLALLHHADDDRRAKDQARIASVVAAFSAYTYYVATLGATFFGSRSEEEWKRLIEASTVFDDLATARHLLADVPSVAIRLVNEARIVLNLERRSIWSQFSNAHESIAISATSGKQTRHIRALAASGRSSRRLSSAIRRSKLPLAPGRSGSSLPRPTPSS